MPRNTERLAWTILIGAFVIFLGLCAGSLFGGQWWLQNAASAQAVTMTSNGTVVVIRPGRALRELNLVDIPVGATITTDPASQASLKFVAADSTEILATLQIYGDTEIIIERADSPRFGLSANPHRLIITLTRGRVRAFINESITRHLQIQVRSQPDALTLIDTPGSNAAVEANFVQTIVTVREGAATVVGLGQGLVLVRDERAEVLPNQTPLGPLPAERNLIVNGDFQEPLSTGWQTDVRPPLDPNDDPGLARLTTSGGRPVINFLRSGQSWGRAGLVQPINRDVRDFKTLRLHLAVFISVQDLWNCGEQGTECPVMVKINYLDPSGAEREWLKGFYYNYNDFIGARVCAPCGAPKDEHERIPPGQWVVYESGNLLELFAQAGVPATTIKSISIYGEGHTFDSSVTEVELLVSE